MGSWSWGHENQLGSFFCAERSLLALREEGRRVRGRTDRSKDCFNQRLRCHNIRPAREKRGGGEEYRGQLGAFFLLPQLGCCLQFRSVQKALPLLTFCTAQHEREKIPRI